MPAGNPLAYFTPEMRTQFFPKPTEEDGLMNTQSYRFARANNATHEAAIRYAKQEMEAHRPEWDMTDAEFAAIPRNDYQAQWDRAINAPADGGAGGGGGGGGQIQGRVTPAAIARQRAIQAEEVRRRQNQQRQGERPSDLFGMGQGDWAGVWERMQQPRGNLFDALAGNQVNAFLNYDNQLDRAYNSPVGPYGQFQQAAAYTAPARASRDIAKIESEANKYIADRKFGSQDYMASKLFEALGGVGANTPGRIVTSYGASVTPEGAPPSLSRYRLWKDMKRGNA